MKYKENEPAPSNFALKCMKCSICDDQGTRSELDQHYMEVHEIDLNIERIEFTSLTTFHEWKKAIEKANHCKYVAACGRKYNHERYECHRSGDFKSKSKGLRSLKRQGSKKIGAYCPSKMIVNKKGNLCSVKFVKTHVGHENELCHVTLTADERAKIANRLAQKVPPIVVLEEIKSSMAATNSRIHLLKLKDLYNISKEFKIDIKTDSNLPDEIDLKKLTDAFKNTQDFENPIVYYKPYGESDGSCPELQPEDFIFIIMNLTQLDLLQQHAKNTLILDRTWKICYGLHSLMLVILDENHNAYPCCFFFTNKDDESRLQILFTILQSRIGVVKTNILMTCVAEQYYKAWTSVTSIPEHHVYCPWSVNQVWVANLTKIANHEKRNEVSEILKKLSEEPDAVKFPTLLNEVVQKITGDEETRQYGQYFCKFYLQKVIKWARCYQMQLGLKDTNDLENVSKIVKYIYVNFKKRGDMNDCIIFLYRILRDRLFSKRVAYSKEEVFRQQQSLEQNHVLSTFENYSVAVNESGSWVVISCAEKTVYEVRKLNTDCRCEISCDKCNVCLHHYTCSCPVSSFEWKMCNHIHYLCTHLQQNIKEDDIVINKRVNFVKGHVIGYDDENRELEKYYFSGSEEGFDDGDNDEIIPDQTFYNQDQTDGPTFDNQSQIGAVLEINGLMDEIISNMDNLEASTFVIDNLKKMLQVLKSKDPLRSNCY